MILSAWSFCGSPLVLCSAFLGYIDAAVQRKVPIFCSLLPVELFISRGLRPVYLTAEELGAVERSEYHCAFHENICSYSKALYEYLLKRQDEFDLIVVPSSCDAMKKLHSALVKKVPEGKLFVLDFPKSKSDEAVGYFADALERLDRFICRR